MVCATRVREEEDTARSIWTFHALLKAWKSRVETLMPPGSDKGLQPAPRRKPHPAGSRPLRRRCCEGGVAPEGGVASKEGHRDLGVGSNCHCCWSDSDRPVAENCGWSSSPHHRRMSLSRATLELTGTIHIHLSLMSGLLVLSFL